LCLMACIRRRKRSRKSQRGVAIVSDWIAMETCLDGGRVNVASWGSSGLRSSINVENVIMKGISSILPGTCMISEKIK